LAPKTQLILFFSAIACFAAAMGVHDSIFNNFLSDTFDMSASQRGWLELPRELPGFLVVVMAGILYALPVTHLAVVGALTFSVGMVGMALLGTSYWPMVAMMMCGSAGIHLLQPVGASVALSLSGPSNRGKRMGQMGAVGTCGMVLGTGFVWLVFDRAAPQYRLGFLCAAAVGGVCAIIYALMHIPHLHQPRAKLVVRRKYRLYYVLELLFGARKQIFITFGPWVLIKVYGEPASSIAGLLMTAALIGIVFKPLAGAAIDRFGERTVMIADGLVLAVVCIGYGYALKLTGDVNTARPIACACFVADNLLFALGSARAVYISRMADSPQEVTSTLAMGVSINHAVSMTIPAAAGAIWTAFDYDRVFLAAAILALAIAAVSTLVPEKRPHGHGSESE
jgi:MFS family permease